MNEIAEIINLTIRLTRENVLADLREQVQSLPVLTGGTWATIPFYVKRADVLALFDEGPE